MYWSAIVDRMITLLIKLTIANAFSKLFTALTVAILIIVKSGKTRQAKQRFQSPWEHCCRSGTKRKWDSQYKSSVTYSQKLLQSIFVHARSSGNIRLTASSISARHRPCENTARSCSCLVVVRHIWYYLVQLKIEVLQSLHEYILWFTW